MNARGSGLLLAVGAALAVAAPASAAFLDRGTATAPGLTTLTVQPPTVSGTSLGCVNGLLGLLGTPSIDVTWTRSAQVAAGGPGWGQALVLVKDGAVLLASTSSAVSASSTSARVVGTQTQPGGTVTALQDATGYTVRVRSTLGGWHSAAVPAAQATVTTLIC